MRWIVHRVRGMVWMSSDGGMSRMMSLVLLLRCLSVGGRLELCNMGCHNFSFPFL